MNLTSVAEKDEGMRLDRWLKATAPSLPRSLIEKGLRKGWIKINGKRAVINTQLHAHDVVGLSNHLTTVGAGDGKTPQKRFSSADLAWIDKAILYHDADMLVLNKPAGLAVQSGSGQSKSVDEHLRAWAAEGAAPRLVHRLDRDTSGVLVLAKTAASAKRLAQMFATHKVEKTYMALVVGVPKRNKATINVPLAKTMSGRDSAVEKMHEDEGGKEAITEYRVVEAYANKLAWVELKPITGRMHQLRVHMAHIGHPIVGDGKYGGANAFVQGLDVAPQLHLHAQEIRIPKPDKTMLTIKAPLPPHMQKTKKLLG
jgi:23S rRNA pseudouridine955/2504/2580 synthase